MLNRFKMWVMDDPRKIIIISLLVLLVVTLIIFFRGIGIGGKGNTNEERAIRTEKRVESETSIDSILSVVESKSSEIKTLREQINQSKKRQNEADRSYKGKDRTFTIHPDSTIAELERIQSDVSR